MNSSGSVPWTVTTTESGVWIGSSKLNSRVMLSPALARLELSLLERMLTAFTTGASTSRATLSPPVASATEEPVLPAWSVTLILKSAKPEPPEPPDPETASSSTVPVTCQRVLLSFRLVKTKSVRPKILIFVRSGVWSVSLEVKLKVMLSPSRPQLTLSLSEMILISESTGPSRSTLTPSPSVRVLLLA